MEHLPQLLRSGLKMALLCLLLFPTGGESALSCYLNLSGIPGTSTDAGFANWTDVLAFQFGVTHPAGTNSPSFTDLFLSKNTDATSPVLAQDVATGAYLPAATLQVVNASSLQVYEIQLYNVSVSSLSDAGTAGGTLPTETLTLHFGKMSWTYTQYDSDRQGNPTNITTDYDLLYGKMPAILSVSGVQNPGSGTMKVTWNARAGTTYNIMGSPQVNGTYTFVTSVTGTNLAPMTLTLPAIGGTYFYRIQELP
jgi:type VI secretion system secreted protein Hcp